MQQSGALGGNWSVGMGELREGICRGQGSWEGNWRYWGSNWRYWGDSCCLGQSKLKASVLLCDGLWTESGPWGAGQGLETGRGTEGNRPLSCCRNADAGPHPGFRYPDP